jgi:hypothetical protein
MGRGGQDKNDWLARPDRPMPVHDGEAEKWPAGECFIGDAADLRFGHSWIVFEVETRQPAALVAAEPNKGNDRPDIGALAAQSSGLGGSIE